MGYEKSKGLVAVASGYDGSSYSYTRLSYKYIQPNGALAITPDQIQDLDSYRNGNGILKRHVLPNKVPSIEWSTPYLRYEDKCRLIALINKAMTYGTGVKKQRRLRARYYNDWSDDYDTHDFYVPDVQFQYGGLYHGAPMYLPIKIQMIGY